MARRHEHEEHTNHEAWAIPYGDLITLLLAFFVVMYALSSVNEGKYRVLSDSLVAAFRSGRREATRNSLSTPACSSNLKTYPSGMSYERPGCTKLLPPAISGDGNSGFHTPLDPRLMMYRYEGAFTVTRSRI